MRIAGETGLLAEEKKAELATEAQLLLGRRDQWDSLSGKAVWHLLVYSAVLWGLKADNLEVPSACGSVPVNTEIPRGLEI